MKRSLLLSIVGLLVLVFLANLSLENSSAGIADDRQNILEQATQPAPIADATRPLPTETAEPSARIVGGAPATHGEWPWQVVVYPPGYICGGVLISPEWVVTAGHCVTSGANIYPPNQMQVILGEYQRNANDGTEQNKQVSQVIRHPNYNNSTLDFDIALLKLTSPATLNNYVSTVPLLRSPADNGLVESGDMTWVTGWGLTSNGSGATTSNILMEVDVPVVANPECSQIWNGITDNMLCAGYTQGGKDSCGGDSGGPLVAGAPGNWKLAGLVSFGSTTCGQANVPGVYTRVSRFVAWIESHTGPLSQVTATPTTTTTATATATPTATQTATTAATATATNTPTATSTPTSTATPTKAPPTPSANVLSNSNFDLGRNGAWVEEGQQLARRIYSADETALPAQPFSGKFLAWFGGVDNEIARLSQQVTVPQVTPILTFRYQIRSSDNCGDDMLYVYLGNRLLTSLSLCTETATQSWVETPALDLGFAAGTQVTLRFEVTTNHDTPSSLLLDDVSLRSNTAVPTPTATTPTQVLQNPNFDNGPDGAWTERSARFGNNPGALIVNSNDIELPVPPHSGIHLVWLGGTQNESATISQTVSINGTGQQLTYQYWIGSEDQCGNDRVEVRFGATLLQQYDLCSPNSTQAWVQATIDMAGHSGQSGNLVFQVNTNSSLNSNFFLDSTSLMVGPAAATPTSTATSAPTPAATATPTAQALRIDVQGGPQAVALTWNPVSSMQTAGYMIQRQENATFVDLATTQDTFYVDTAEALVSGNQYCYRVVAVNAGNSPLETSDVACATFGRLTIGIPALTAANGESVLVPLNAGPVDGLRIADGDLWLDYNPNVASPTGISAAGLTSNYIWSYSTTSVDADTERLSIKVAPQTPSAPVPLHGVGTLARIDFQVLGAAGAQTSLDLVEPSGQGGSQVKAATGENQTKVLDLALTDGSLSIGAAGVAYRTGDVNGDGIITNQDAVQALAISAQARPAVAQELSSGDLNGNGIIDAGDSAQIVRQLNTGQATSLRDTALRDTTTARATQATTTTLSLEAASAIPGGEALLILGGKTFQQVSGGDFVIVYDPTKVAGFRAVTPTGLANSSTHTALYDDQHGRLHVSFAGNDPISGDGALLEIRAKLETTATDSMQFVLAAATLYDTSGRDFVRSTPGNVIVRQNGTVTPSGGTIFLPNIRR